MGVREWRRLYRELTAAVPTGFEPSHPGEEAVTVASRQFEREIGLKLPPTYKSFVKVFGPGEIGGFFRIWIPGDKELNYDLAHEYEETHLGCTQEAASEADKFNARFVFFGSTIGGDLVGWDPKDVTDPKGPEYRVHFIARHHRGIPVASSFVEFVSEVCLGKNLDKLCGWQTPPDYPPREFLPYAKLKRKSKTSKR